MADLITRLRLTLRPVAPAGDVDLLARFVEQHDQEAFADVVRWHGPMVYGVCRRALGDGPDAEDAYQAVFVVLAKRAAAVAAMTSVAGWLYGVACLTARKARTRRAKRRAKESGSLPDVPCPLPTAEPDLGGVIDEELAKVPEKYRTAVVLCELRQLTLGEAAAELGVPRGTVASRLARGRGMLGKRLLRRGLLAAGVGGGAAFGRVPLTLDERLLGLVFRPAVAPEAPASSLSQEVMRTMSRTRRLACCAGLLLASGLVLGGLALTPTPTAAAPVPEVKAKSAEELKVLDRVAVENVGGLLACPTVAKEIALTDEQKAKLDEAWGEVSAKLTGQFKARLKGAPQTPELMLAVLGFLDEAVRENDAEAIKVLGGEQLRRLRQIQLQKEGPAALVGRYAVRALALTSEQEDKLTRAVGRLNKTGFLLLNFELGAAEEAAAGQNAAMMKDTVRRVLAAQAAEVDAVADETMKVLTDEQRKRWKQMTGEPIPTAELLKASSPFSDRRVVKAFEDAQTATAPPPPAPAQPPAKEEKEKK